MSYFYFLIVYSLSFNLSVFCYFSLSFALYFISTWHVWCILHCLIIGTHILSDDIKLARFVWPFCNKVHAIYPFFCFIDYFYYRLGSVDYFLSLNPWIFAKFFQSIPNHWYYGSDDKDKKCQTIRIYFWTSCVPGLHSLPWYFQDKSTPCPLYKLLGYMYINFVSSSRFFVKHTKQTHKFRIYNIKLDWIHI